MPFGPDHERWADATGAYLLDALGDEERAGFEEHLATCVFCREEVAFLRAASDALPVAVPQVAPPPALRARIMDVVEREAELLRAASSDVPAEPVRRAPGDAWWRRLALGRPRPALALAATLLVLAGVAGGVLAGGGGSDPAVRTVAGSVEAAGAGVQLVVAGSQARLEARGLPEPPRGRVYQVWVKRPGRDPEPTDALFVPAADGTATAGVPGSVDGLEAVLVTDEPRGGSPAPTGRVLIQAPVAAS